MSHEQKKSGHELVTLGLQVGMMLTVHGITTMFQGFRMFIRSHPFPDISDLTDYSVTSLYSDDSGIKKERKNKGRKMTQTACLHTTSGHIHGVWGEYEFKFQKEVD